MLKKYLQLHSFIGLSKRLLSWSWLNFRNDSYCPMYNKWFTLSKNVSKKIVDRPMKKVRRRHNRSPRKKRTTRFGGGGRQPPPHRIVLEHFKKAWTYSITKARDWCQLNNLGNVRCPFQLDGILRLQHNLSTFGQYILNRSKHFQVMWAHSKHKNFRRSLSPCSLPWTFFLQSMDSVCHETFTRLVPAK